MSHVNTLKYSKLQVVVRLKGIVNIKITTLIGYWGFFMWNKKQKNKKTDLEENDFKVKEWWN